MKKNYLTSISIYIVLASLMFVCYTLYMGNEHWTEADQVMACGFVGANLVITLLNLLKLRKMYDAHK